MTAFNPYIALGLPHSATQAEIKSTYRKLARKYHPDSSPNNQIAEDRFKEISNAYSLLSDPTKRRKFDTGEIDAHGHPYTRTRDARSEGYNSYKRSSSSDARHSGGAKKSNFNNFFKNRQSIKANGADVSYTLRVNFLDAAAGSTQSIRMTTGKTLKVNVPAGTESGQVLRLKNQGMNGIGGGKAGDALIEIQIKDDTTFHSEGLDTFSEEAVTLSEALLGGRIEARTIHGPVIVTVPEGSNSGTKLRLKGRGIHNSGSPKRGDHYVTLKVVLPRKEDIDLKKFVKKWAARKPYSVRSETLNSTAAE
ncbi:MAG: J domain-containing protein [Magnetovibrio sp.]|nr:J domain-containing protein [Magnetovibrio sp.]